VISTATPSAETLLVQTIFQLIVVLAAARLLGIIFRRFGQPQVCGEIGAGLILGPSVLGRVAPATFHWVFSPSVAPFFALMSQIGLIILMFLIGLEFDFLHLREKGRSAVSISVLGIAFPFVLGLLISRFLYSYVAQEINPVGFSLFMGTALSITAMPVLGRIMTELNIHKSVIGSLTMASAALDDVSGWTILALVSATVRSSFSVAQTLLMVAEIAAYTVFTLWVTRPLLKILARRTLKREGSNMSTTTLTILILVVLASAAITSLIGIFAVFGAFIIGAMLSDEEEFKNAILVRLRDFTSLFFLPVFFANTGLRTDVGSIQGVMMWSLCFLVLAAAIVGKLGGCYIGARLSGLPWRDSLVVGVLMNTRGLMELVAINIGFELGVIPRSVFFMLVLMAVVTTYMTTPLLRRAVKRTALESLVAQSSLMSHGSPT
jgi:Kef-type K+ transport system membrane component KefB